VRRDAPGILRRAKVRSALRRAPAVVTAFCASRGCVAGTPGRARAFVRRHPKEEATMGFGRGALLWLLGIPLPIILLLALFWR
jgi:hypothetical protein